MAQIPTDISSKSRLVTALLAWFLGPFGAHRFYVGKTGSAIVMLVLTITVIGAIISGIWALIDTIRIILGNFRDGGGNLVYRWTEPGA